MRDRQPLRVVVGSRALPAGARLRDDTAPLLLVPSAAPAEVLRLLFERHEVQHVLLEAGPTLSTAFLRAGLVDEVIWFLAPKVLGAGRSVVADLDVRTITEAFGLRLVGVSQVGTDVRVDLSVG